MGTPLIRPVFVTALIALALGCSDSGTTTLAPPVSTEGTAIPRGPTPDMAFDELVSFSMVLDYEELYRNMDKYSVVTWYETGGDPPLIYFRGKIGATEATEVLGAEILSAQLYLADNNAIIFRYGPEDVRIPLAVGDDVEWIGVCSELTIYSTNIGNKTLPTCATWQIRMNF